MALVGHATGEESGRREGRGCRAEDGVREKIKELAGVERGGGGLQERTRQYTYTQNIGEICTCVGCLGRRSTPHMKMDWGYTVPYLKVHKRENFLGSDFEICTFS